MNAKRILRRPWVYSVEVQNNEATVHLVPGYVYKVTGENMQTFRNLKAAYESTNMLLVTRNSPTFAGTPRAAQLAQIMWIGKAKGVDVIRTREVFPEPITVLADECLDRGNDGVWRVVKGA